jgi:lipoate-protein ligase B
MGRAGARGRDESRPYNPWPGHTPVSVPLWVVELGRVEYDVALALQRRLAAERDDERVPDVLLLLEHPPVITLGRRGSLDHVYADRTELDRLGIALRETNRGGLVTYHGPGQVVGYPIARLRGLARDAPTYVSGLEQTMLRTLAELGVAAFTRPGERGVFAERGKIGAIGVAVSRGVTMHGFALNVSPDLRHFDLIDPCGLGHLGVTSLERELGRTVELGAVREALARSFAAVFARTPVTPPRDEWDRLFAHAMSVRTGGAGLRAESAPMPDWPGVQYSW